MITQAILKEKLVPLTKTKEADKVGIVFFHSSLQVSRFTNSQIHQHLHDEDKVIYFRLLCNGRLGVASTNSLDEQNLKETFKKALHIARLKLPTKEKRDIPSFKPQTPLSHLYFEETAKFSAEARVKILQKIFAEAETLGVKFSGNLYNGSTQIAVVSPEGNMNYHDYTLAGIKLIAHSKNVSGFASQTSHDIHALNIKSIADTAIKRCLHGLKIQTLKTPNRYDVILQPQATAELIGWLSYIGFGAKSLFEETSFFFNRLGKKITGEGVNIYDSGRDRNTFVLPFDFEGLPRKKVYLIKKGTANAVLCDTYYAKLLKVKSNGHASLPDDPEGPSGENLVMEAGDIPEEKIIKLSKHAVLITRLHYINGFLDTHRALMTGMTRDGTFLIENGKVTKALTNMRFTESILEAFSRIKYISKERKLIADYLEGFGSVYAPTLYIKDFNFTS